MRITSATAAHGGQTAANTKPRFSRLDISIKPPLPWETPMGRLFPGIAAMLPPAEPDISVTLDLDRQPGQVRINQADLINRYHVNDYSLYYTERDLCNGIISPEEAVTGIMETLTALNGGPPITRADAAKLPAAKTVYEMLNKHFPVIAQRLSQPGGLQIIGAYEKTPSVTTAANNNKPRLQAVA